MGETVTGNYFQMLGVKRESRTYAAARRRQAGRAAGGRSSRTASGTASTAASPSAVGQSIRIHGQPYTIVGVAPATFTGMVPLLAPELWTPMAYVDDVEPGGIISNVPSPTGNTRLERRGTRWMFVEGTAEAGATYDGAAAQPAA